MNNFITAKFKSRCTETGKQIAKGESIFYDRSRKKAFCQSSDRYKQESESKQTGEFIQQHEEMYFDNFCRDNNI